VEEELFEDEGDVRIFLRKHQAHQLTPKGRLWELADGNLDLRFTGATMDKLECEDGALVLDWVVNDNNYMIALMDNGIEEMGSVVGMNTRYFISASLLTLWFRSPETEQEDEQMCT